MSSSKSATEWGALHRGREKNPQANPRAHRRSLAPRRGPEHSTRQCQWEQEQPQANSSWGSYLPHPGSHTQLQPLHSKSNKINGLLSRALVAVPQREKLTNPVVWGPPQCYFLACHLSPESLCKGPLEAGSSQSTVPALWPAQSQGCAGAAAMLPLKCCPQSFICFTLVTPVCKRSSAGSKSRLWSLAQWTLSLTLLRPCHSLQSHAQGLMLRSSQGQQSVTSQGLPALPLAQK